VNHHVKSLRMVFKAAKRDGAVTDNPTEFVDTVRARAAVLRTCRPFTINELGAVLSIADEEWRSMILFGLYSGQRLSDIAQPAKRPSMARKADNRRPDLESQLEHVHQRSGLF
jgi:integrase